MGELESKREDLLQQQNSKVNKMRKIQKSTEKENTFWLEWVDQTCVSVVAGREAIVLGYLAVLTGESGFNGNAAEDSR